MCLEKIRNFVGEFTREQLQYVDYFIGTNILVLIPSPGKKDLSCLQNHIHPSYSFILFFDDTYTISIEGRTISSIRGKLQAISPEIQHQKLTQDSFSHYIALFISKSFFGKLLKMYSYDAIPAFKGEFYDPGQDFLPVLKEFMIEWENQMPGFDHVMKGLESKIGHSIIRMILSLKPNIYPVTHRLDISNVIKYIYEHYHEDIDVLHMAQYVGLSTSHFSYIFREESGYSPLDYLIKVRLRKAQLLLRTGDKSITEIAKSCGFHGISYFSASFHKAFDTSPTDYRKAFRK
jgi:AraC-like DNA-binding protein